VVAQGERVEFLDLALHIEASSIDGAHLDATEHRKLAELLVPIVRRLLGTDKG
jgi:hypothetical protein